MIVDTGCYAAGASVIDRCSYLIGLRWPRAECRRRVLYRVTQAKTARRAARAVGQRFAPWRVSRFMLALNDSAAALSALVPVAPRERSTPRWWQRTANSFEAYWAPLSELTRSRVNSDCAELCVKPRDRGIACAGRVALSDSSA